MKYRPAPSRKSSVARAAKTDRKYSFLSLLLIAHRSIRFLPYLFIRYCALLSCLNPLSNSNYRPRMYACTLYSLCLRRYSKRTSSAHWEADSITLVEKRTYRMQMGYGNPSMGAPVGGSAVRR
jgi:hypothetical protein